MLGCYTHNSVVFFRVIGRNLSFLSSVYIFAANFVRITFLGSLSRKQQILLKFINRNSFILHQKLSFYTGEKSCSQQLFSPSPYIFIFIAEYPKVTYIIY